MSGILPPPRSPAWGCSGLHDMGAPSASVLHAPVLRGRAGCSGNMLGCVAALRYMELWAPAILKSRRDSIDDDWQVAGKPSSGITHAAIGAYCVGVAQFSQSGAVPFQSVGAACPQSPSATVMRHDVCVSETAQKQHTDCTWILKPQTA